MKKIMYSSTNGHPELLNFKEALLRGQAPDKGLYVPTAIPRISIMGNNSGGPAGHRRRAGRRP